MMWYILIRKLQFHKTMLFNKRGIKMDGAKRIAKWDNLKLFLIFTVVLGHMADLFYSQCSDMKGLFIFIYIFHMPAFIFISGLFSKKTVDNKNYGKILPYVTLYFISQFLLFIFSAIFAKAKTLYLFDSDGIPWFVLSLFWMNLITMYTKKIKPQWVLALSLILSVFAGYNHSTIDKLAILRTINFYPFFYLGYILDREKLTAFLNKKQIKIASAVFIATIGILCFTIPQKVAYFRSFVTGRVPYSNIGNAAVWGGFIRLGVFAVSLIFVMALISLTPSSAGRISFLGTRTLGVYVTHFCFIYAIIAIPGLTKAIIDMPVLGRILLLLIITALLVAICSNKYFDIALKKIMDHNAKLKKQ